MTYEELPNYCFINYNHQVKLVFKDCTQLYDPFTPGDMHELNAKLQVNELEAEMMCLAVTFTGFSYLRRHMIQCERIAESMLRQIQKSQTLFAQKGAV
ncbi:hypothetical protein [Listeria goaensis]|uniref:hypothetical protein n=1 Tax=Listeria goaensis TaxID=1649188 RepID=UPI000B588784|nr:hypothetical protein [Listeria goaensis]